MSFCEKVGWEKLEELARREHKNKSNCHSIPLQVQILLHNEKKVRMTIEYTPEQLEELKNKYLPVQLSACAASRQFVDKETVFGGVGVSFSRCWSVKN